MQYDHIPENYHAITTYILASDAAALIDFTKRAMASGSMSLSAPEDQFYGDRSAGFLDPYGNMWWLAARVEKLSSPENLAKGWIMSFAWTTVLLVIYAVPEGMLIR